MNKKNKKFKKIIFIAIIGICFYMVWFDTNKKQDDLVAEAVVSTPQASTSGKLLSSDYSVKYITSSMLTNVPKGLACEEFFRILGPTKDVGSDLHIGKYIVDNNLELFISFINIKETCNLSGSELLISAEAISDSKKIGIRGVVTNIIPLKDGISIFVEGTPANYTGDDKIMVTVNSNTKIKKDGINTTVVPEFKEIKKGDIVEVKFRKNVAASSSLKLAEVVSIINLD